MRVNTSIGTDLPFPIINFRVRTHINLTPSRLIGLIGQPLAIGGENSFVFILTRQQNTVCVFSIHRQLMNSGWPGKCFGIYQPGTIRGKTCRNNYPRGIYEFLRLSGTIGPCPGQALVVGKKRIGQVAAIRRPQRLHSIPVEGTFAECAPGKIIGPDITFTWRTDCQGYLFVIGRQRGLCINVSLDTHRGNLALPGHPNQLLRSNSSTYTGYSLHIPSRQVNQQAIAREGIDGGSE